MTDTSLTDPVDSPVPATTEAPGESRSTGRIVVGVDGSPGSEHALRWAASLAALMGCGVDAVAAWEIPMTAYGWPNFPIGWEPGKDAAATLAATTKSAYGDHPPADLRHIVREGNAITVLMNAGSDARMLVVGSRGHGGFVGMLLGSVSAACAEHARCPVLVVHGDTAPPGDPAGSREVAGATTAQG
jgi:nucleotide-binding universal stress UspA family protein